MINKIKKTFYINTLIIATIFLFFGCSNTSDKEDKTTAATQNNQLRASNQMLMEDKDYSNIFWIKGTGSVKQNKKLLR